MHRNRSCTTMVLPKATKVVRIQKVIADMALVDLAKARKVRERAKARREKEKERAKIKEKEKTEEEARTEDAAQAAIANPSHEDAVHQGKPTQSCALLTRKAIVSLGTTATNGTQRNAGTTITEHVT